MSSDESASPASGDVDVVIADPNDPGDVADLATLRSTWAAGSDAGPNYAVDASFVASFGRWWRTEVDQRVFWLARLGAQPVAMVNLRIVERMPKPGEPASRWAYLGNMFVLEELRDRGVGARLATEALDYADKAAMAHVMLNPSERARPFYERLGFSGDNAMLVRPRPVS